MFKTKKEKYAYVQGLKKGSRGGKLYRIKKVKGQYIDGIFESNFAMRGVAEAARKYDRERERKAATANEKLPF